MARQDQIRDLIFNQNGEPVIVQSIVFTTAAATTALVASDAEGGRTQDSDLMLQTDQDVYVRFLDTASGPNATATTAFLINGGTTFQLCPKHTRTNISVIGKTAGGTLRIFAIR